MTRVLAIGLLLLCGSALAQQIPDEPKPVYHEFSLTSAFTERYSLTHSQHEVGIGGDGSLGAAP